MAQQVGSGSVFGRDPLIERIWRKLETHSLRFTAERRVGKTTVMKKMAAEPRDGWKVVFIDLEGVASPEGFAEALLSRIRPLMPAGQAGQQWFQKILETVSGTEIGGVIKLPEFSRIGWRPTIEKAFEGICSQARESKILILFDELPYMLQKIAVYGNQATTGENAALEMLDTLRAVRGKHQQNLRMIFAGSVGLHHVISELRGETFASQPVNDMPLVEIRSLELNDAIALATQLLRIEAVDLGKETSIEELSHSLAIETDRVPFYLQRVVARLAELDRPVVLDDVRRMVNQHHLISDETKRYSFRFPLIQKWWILAQGLSS